MSYENAPATKMLATSCACCGRPLVDAKSVEVGIGPDCREKYGYDTEVGSEERETANKLVYAIAANPRSIDTLYRCEALRALGFTRLAAIVEKRTAAICVTLTGGEMLVRAPYDPSFVDTVRNIPGRRWHAQEKTWGVPTSQRGLLWKALLRHYAGALGIGPKGPFVVREAAQAAA
jgi:hypothetical protein